MDVIEKKGLVGRDSCEEEIDSESYCEDATEDHPAAPKDPIVIVADVRAKFVDKAVGHCYCLYRLFP